MAFGSTERVVMADLGSGGVPSRFANPTEFGSGKTFAQLLAEDPSAGGTNIADFGGVTAIAPFVLNGPGITLFSAAISLNAVSIGFYSTPPITKPNYSLGDGADILAQTLATLGLISVT
jgi:hypothetical protein